MDVVALLGHVLDENGLPGFEGETDQCVVDRVVQPGEVLGALTRRHLDHQAITGGVTINGLAIINDKPNLGYSAHTQPPGGLPLYYRQNVIGGPNAFLLVVEDFNSFADAMANKLAKEIDVAGSAGEKRVSLLNSR